VLAVILIVTYVYAIMGMYLFGAIDYTTQTTTLSAYANFSSFPVAMLMMIRCMTGEGYNAIMQVRIMPPLLGRSLFNREGYTQS
jgi:NADH:ubiquinone oxidoreductase subunit 6 (subunit J)